MLFSSISFLYYFLPSFLIVYLCIPWKFKNLVLLLASLVFYFFGEPVYILILIFSSIVDYVNGLAIERFRRPLAATSSNEQLEFTNPKAAKAILGSSIIINVGLLAVFKYSGFFLDNINATFKSSLINPGLALPLGISFYTFQTMSYTIDVYRGRVKAQKNFINFAAYVCMFPQLVAGPIVRYSSVDTQLTNRKASFDYFAAGVTRFIIGLSKKVLIANTIGQLSATAYSLCNQTTIISGSNDASVILYWIGAAAFALQIYFDFSGYSDMAIGLGKMMGFDFPENFNYPFTARSITDFWRRWHITLGGWFKDYVYFPLGGSHVSNLKWIRNLVIVWALTGFWHGASWNFILWGLYFAVFLAIEKLVLAKWLQNAPAYLAHFYTLFILIFSFVIFDTVNITLLPERLGGMFGLGEIPFINDVTLYCLRSYSVLMFIALIATTPLSIKAITALRKNSIIEKVIAITEPLILAALLILSTAYIVDSSFNPFLYFRF